MKTKAQV